MKLKLPLLAGTVFACCLSLPASAQPITPTGPDNVLGAKKKDDILGDIEIRNLQDEPLGHIKDLGIDLVNGRIVEVLVVSDQFLGMGGRVVAVPPTALVSDVGGGVYRLNVSAERFKTAPEIDLSKWSDAGRSERVAAAYHFFGQEPYFLEEGAPAGTTPAGHPKVLLGYVERSSKILGLAVGNFQNQPLGTVCSLSLDTPKGRILNVIVLSYGPSKAQSIIPARALSFNDKRDALLLDDSKLAFEDEPRYIFTEASVGHPATSQEEAYKGPHTSVALEQGTSYRDVDRTVHINQDIRSAKINARNVEVGTINGRVTLRGWVNSSADKTNIGAIAIAAARLELVDNQITVGNPAVVN